MGVFLYLHRHLLYLSHGHFNLWSFLFASSSFMASSSILPPVSEMAEIRSHGIGVPILFPIDAQGIAVVSELHLCLRFSLQPNTVWVDREIFDDT